MEERLVETQRAMGLTLEREVVEHLASWYGTEAPDVLEYSASRHLVGRLAASSPVLGGEVAYATEHSSAVRLSDAVLRRTSLGSTGHPGREALTRAADIMGSSLGWTPERVAAEMALVEERYPPIAP